MGSRLGLGFEQQVDASVTKAMGRKMQKPMTRSEATAFICRVRARARARG